MPSVADWDNITSITRSKILPGVEDQITKDNPTLFRLLKAGELLDGGKRIEKIIFYALSGQGGWYSGLDTLKTGYETTRTRAFWNWRQCHQAVVVSNIDVAKNAGTSKVVDLVTEDMEEAQKSMKDRFGTALYTAQVGDAMDSLVDACDDGTNVGTYGDINRANYNWWKGYYNGTGGSLSLSMMATAYDAIKSGTDVPSIIVTHESEWTSYEALLQPQVRFMFTTGDYPKIDGGFQTMMFRGTPVVADEYCPDGQMYFLNEKYLKFYTLKHPDYPTDAMGFTTTKFREPTDQDGKVGYVLWYGNLISTQPRRQGVIRNIT